MKTLVLGSTSVFRQAILEKLKAEKELLYTHYRPALDTMTFYITANSRMLNEAQGRSPARKREIKAAYKARQEDVV